MKKINTKSSYWLYSILTLSWLSGLTFFSLKTWFVMEGEYGAVTHPLQFTALQIHGASAFCFMLMVGFFLGAHVPHKWALIGKNKIGSMLILVSFFMVLSAYLLYYIAEDEVRFVLAYAHLAVGFLLPFTLLIHIKKSKRI